MQVKTVNFRIKSKMTEWLETINDEQLRKDVKENILVSGGCIASMLLREEVNDYDVYIQNIDVLVRLAEYYCPDRVLDGRLKDVYIQADKDELGEAYNSNSQMAIRLAGLKPDQVKLNIPSEGIRIEPLVNHEEPYGVAFMSQNAISLTDDLQIVLRFSGDAETIHKNFDFIHATNYFTFKDGIVTNKKALESLLTKTLQYQGSLYPLTSIIRMKKFILRGWRINAGEILKIMFQISHLDLKNPVTLEEQLIGVDVAYFAVLISILHNTDPVLITPEYINNLIDKVFNSFDDLEDLKQ